MSVKINYLDFEQPIAELEAKIDGLRSSHDEHDGIDISKELNALDKKKKKLSEDIYGNLTAWQISQIARHTQRPYTLDYIKGIFTDFVTLRNHSEFNIKNPNRVRALYSAFAINNPVKFHDPSGQGYAILRDVIIELNAINPQIAARQVAPFREWKRYTPQLQALMKAALQAMMDTPNLSNDVFEIVSKSLNG